MASITLLKNGNWRTRIRRAGGRAVSENFRTKVQASAWVVNEESNVHKRIQRDYRVADRMSVRELLDRYEREVAVKMKSAMVLKYHLALFINDLGHLGHLG